MNFKKLASIALVGALFLTGCSSTTEKKESGNETTEAKNTVTIEHDKGSTEVNINPEKVVVFDYGILDAMENLELQEKVVGVAQSSNIPEFLSEFKDEKYANVGSLKELDFEAINSLQPELIIISGRQEPLYDELSKIAPTISLDTDGTKYMEELNTNMNIVGKIFEMEDVITEKLGEIDEKIESLKSIVEEKDADASTLIINEGEMNVLGKGSRFGYVYNEFGFKENDENVDESTHGQNVSYEYLAEKNPDYILVIDRSSISKGEQVPARDVLNNDLVNATTAGKEGNIIYLDTATWYLTGGGLTSTNKMIDEITEGINK